LDPVEGSRARTLVQGDGRSRGQQFRLRRGGVDQVGAAAALTLFALALAPLAQGDAARTVAPRKAIAGFEGFESVSTLVYAKRPEDPHKLRATYVFPDRARWWIGTGDEKSLARQMRYRLGTALYALESDAVKSRELVAQERDALLAQ